MKEEPATSPAAEVKVEVTGLFIYPVKSCKRIPLREAQLTPEGLRFDRQWMVVGEAARALTQRDIPLLSQIETGLRDDTLVLSRPGHGSIEISVSESGQSPSGQRVHTKVWKDECEVVVASDEASRWLTQAAESKKPLNLVRMAPGFVRPQSQPETMGENTRTQFADAAPFLVTDEASLARLNEVLTGKGEVAVPMNRFRPNIVVRGLEPFGEHALRHLGNEHYRFAFRMPCERCVVPTIDQETSVRHPKKEPFATLRDLNPLDPDRRQPLFGQYATLEFGAGGIIAVGDRLLG